MPELRRVFSVCESSAFYAGFGNKDTDAVAYLSIAKRRIYIIDSLGNIGSMKTKRVLSYRENASRSTFPSLWSRNQSLAACAVKG